MKEPKVSIVIPVGSNGRDLKECVDHCVNLDYENFEILVLPDEPVSFSHKTVQVIPTGPVGPAEKRDLSLSYAKGEIIAFLDDDAYPRPDWLAKAVRHFEDDQVAGVGGPAVTPAKDSPHQKASAGVFESRLGGGSARARYLPVGLVREVDDWPSVNLFVRKECFAAVGGFNSQYWPGEDTKLCYDLTHGLGRKILYDPEVVVWHHRRTVFRPHLKQISNYALHRGHFARRFPETSRRLSYFLPSIFTILLISGALLSTLSVAAAAVFTVVIAIYLILIIGASISAGTRYRDLTVSLLTGPAVLLTHLFYGAYFTRGLFAREIKR